MRIWTIQLGRWRLAESAGIPLVDTTVKSGRGVSPLEPTWDMVMGYKQGRLTEMDYTGEYLQLLRDRYRADPQVFTDFIARYPQVAIACYCGDGCFCHRYIAVQALGRVAQRHVLDFTYVGELR